MINTADGYTLDACPKFGDHFSSRRIYLVQGNAIVSSSMQA